MAAKPPSYPEGRNLLAGKTILVTAAAGTGIGFATAKRALEEGAEAGRERRQSHVHVLLRQHQQRRQPCRQPKQQKVTFQLDSPCI